METLPNLCFTDFYRRIGNSSKKKIYMVKAARSRQTFEVEIRDSSDQQFLSQDLSKHVAINLLDKDLRSRQEVILGPREDCCDKRQDAETKKKLERRILSRHRSGCRGAKRRQLLSRQKNDVATRNDCFIN